MRDLPPRIQSKSRMRERARTDLCGGCRETGVPTATEPPDLAENMLYPRHRRRRRSPARVMFVSKESGHHGMDAFDNRTPPVPEEISEHPPVMLFGDASQSRGHLARGVELPPCEVVGFLPLFARHARMVNNRF
jgi:hypothetical protein